MNLKYVKSANFIRLHALNNRLVKEFLNEIESDHGDVVYHSEVRWLSRGKVLKHFIDLRHEIDIFMTEKSKQLPELSNPSWLWDLAILCDLTAYLNELISSCKAKTNSSVMCMRT